MIEKAMERQEQGKKPVDSRGFILMDDCLASKGSWMRDQPILELLFNGRHYHLMYILTMQFPLGISPELRCNFDYIFLLKEDGYSNLKRLYEHYAGIFPTFDSFKLVFKELTANYGSMVIVNNGESDSFLDKICWYKAPNDHVSMIGCEQFINYHNNNYNKLWKKHTRGIDIGDIVNSRSKNKEPTFKIDKVGYNR
jgi:hypothetical protein